MEGHISRHIDSALKTSLLYKLFVYLDEKSVYVMIIGVVLLFCIIFIFLSQDIHSYDNILQNEFNTLVNDNTIDGISKKLNII
jgi:hypothetical protein